MLEYSRSRTLIIVLNYATKLSETPNAEWHTTTTTDEHDPKAQL